MSSFSKEQRTSNTVWFMQVTSTLTPLLAPFLQLGWRINITGEASVVAPIISFTADIFLSAMQHHSRTTQDHTLISNVLPVPNATVVSHSAELSHTSLCSHSKLAHLPPSPLLLFWCVLCWVSFLCRVKRDYFNKDGLLSCSVLNHYWYKVLVSNVAQ